MGSKEWSEPAKIVNGLAGELPEVSEAKSGTCDAFTKSKFEDFGDSRTCANETSMLGASSYDCGVRRMRSGGGESLGAGGTICGSKRSRLRHFNLLGTRSGGSSDCREVIAEGQTPANISGSFVDRSGTSRSASELAARYSLSWSESHELIDSSARGETLGLERLVSVSCTRTGGTSG